MDSTVPRQRALGSTLERTVTAWPSVMAPVFSSVIVPLILNSPEESMLIKGRGLPWESVAGVRFTCCTVPSTSAKTWVFSWELRSLSSSLCFTDRWYSWVFICSSTDCISTVYLNWSSLLASFCSFSSWVFCSWRVVSWLLMPSSSSSAWRMERSISPVS